MIYKINHIWTAEMKWKWRNDRRSERNLCLKKIQDFNGVWTPDLVIIGAMLYQLSYEATDVGSRSNFFHGNIWTHNWPAPYVSGFKTQLVERLTGNREVTGSNPVEVLDFFQASLRNCINCVHCDDHFFIFTFVFCCHYVCRASSVENVCNETSRSTSDNRPNVHEKPRACKTKSFFKAVTFMSEWLLNCMSTVAWRLVWRPQAEF